MKKLLGLLIGTTMMASIPVMADEQVLRDSELDTVTAGGSASASAFASGDVYVSGSYTLDVYPTAGYATNSADIYPFGPSHVTLGAGASSD